MLVYINPAYHRMRLATASLTIGEDSPIIPHQYILNESICSLRINHFLLGLYPKNMIISKCLHIINIINFNQFYLIVILISLDDALTASLFLLCIHRPDSHNYFDRLAHLFMEGFIAIYYYLYYTETYFFCYYI